MDLIVCLVDGVIENRLVFRHNKIYASNKLA